MVGRALSETKKRRKDIDLLEKWTQEAIIFYQAQRAPDREDNEEAPLGLRPVCRLMEERCWKEDKKKIKLDHNTLSRRLGGGKSKAQSNAERHARFTNDEEDQIVDYAIRVALRGFPLSLRRLSEIANQILKGRDGDDYDPVGVNWPARFVERHGDRLKNFWSRPLDNSRGRAVNPATKEGFFKLLKEVIRGNGNPDDKIPDELIFGADETGLQEGIGTTERVIGPASKSVQHQQRSGTRENITVLVTICADGTSLPPAVIFKGQHYQASWQQNNPLNASLGYQKKGYIDGEISTEWIKMFDEQTKAKANGRRRLLLVDGHSSHYTLGFLDYARTHNIEVLCYPSHSTHVYQGLDVVIFSVLKRRWSAERDDYEREKGHKVIKQEFLGLYAKAHIAALTVANVKKAFEKTGVVPYNPDVITEDMMAPSEEHSIRNTIPVDMSSPVRAVSNLLNDFYQERREAQTEPIAGPSGYRPSRSNSPESPTPRTPQNRHLTALQQLTGTSARYLLSPTPLTSAIQPPLLATQAISPRKRRYDELLAITPRTEYEQQLQDALRESDAAYNGMKDRVTKMQAKSVIQNAFVQRISSQLQEHEERQKKPKKRAKKLGDGKAKLLTGDDFYGMVETAAQEADDEARAKETRADITTAYKKAVERWTTRNEARIARNSLKTEKYKIALTAWKLNRVGPQPKRGQLEKGVKKPTKKSVEAALEKQRERAAEMLNGGSVSDDDDDEWEGDESSHGGGSDEEDQMDDEDE